MNEPNGIIAVITDFGNRDNYVGAMKGVILNINQEAKIIDITNDLPPHNIRAAAFQLYTAYKYFPKGTTFLCVVDPGVGTNRKALAVETRNYFFVAPDNGLIYPVIIEEEVKKIVSLENKKYFLESISSTFHGRDIFAPVAAWITRRTPIEEFGRELTLEDIVKLELTEYSEKKGGIVGVVNYIDRFGNVITSIPNEVYYKLPKKMFLKTYARFAAKKALTYGEGVEEELLVIEGSHGFIEVAINQGNAAEKLKIDIGDEILFEF